MFARPRKRVDRTSSGALAAKADGVFQRHFTADTTDIGRFADKQLDLAFEDNLSTDPRAGTDDDFGFAVVTIPAPAARFFHDQITMQVRLVTQRNVAVHGAKVAADFRRR